MIPLAESIGSKLIVEADVQNDASLDNVFGTIEKEWGGLDFLVHAIAYSNKDELTGRFVNTSRANFANTMDISCYSLIEVARRAAPLMTVAKAALESTVRYLANDLGPQGIRVNAISPGPMRTLAGAAIGGARKTYRATEANAPLRSNATLESVGGTAVYLASDYGAFTTGEVICVDGGYHVLGMAQPENL